MKKSVFRRSFFQLLAVGISAPVMVPAVVAWAGTTGWTQSLPKPPSQPPKVNFNIPPPPVPLPPPPVVPPLPPPPPRFCSSGCSVTRNDQVLIFLNSTSTQLTQGAEKWRLLYKFLESSGKTVTFTELGPHYRKIIELDDSSNQQHNATKNNFVVALLDAEKDPTIKAIDLVISLHGDPGGKIYFKDGPVNMAALAEEITQRRNNQISTASHYGKVNKDLLNGRKQKLRIVYSAACFGAEMIPSWHKIGFAAAAGAFGVHCDSPASFPTFLSTWKNGYSFAEAVNRANMADSRRAYDTWAKAINSPAWANANSSRNLVPATGVDKNNLFIWTKTSQTYPQ